MRRVPILRGEPDGALRRQHGLRAAHGVRHAAASLGRYASHLYLHPRTRLHRAPDDIRPTLLSLFNPLSNAVRWAGERPRTRAGDTVVIAGPGQRGLLSVVVARELGAAQVIVTGTAADAIRPGTRPRARRRRDHRRGRGGPGRTRAGPDRREGGGRRRRRIGARHRAPAPGGRHGAQGRQCRRRRAQDRQRAERPSTPTSWCSARSRCSACCRRTGTTR